LEIIGREKAIRMLISEGGRREAVTMQSVMMAVRPACLMLFILSVTIHPLKSYRKKESYLIYPLTFLIGSVIY